jgi:hypothetical protein
MKKAKRSRAMSIILNTERLHVEVAEPGEFPNITTRFDRAGFVTRIVLDNKYQFCTREPDNLTHPCSGGVGICSEFRLPEPAVRAKIGEQFPKPGVGLLTKEEDGGYTFHYKYKCDPFDVICERTESGIIFSTQPKPCMGYAIQQTKKLLAVGNSLLMIMTLKNVGEREIEFDEYCHNFLSIEHLPIGEEYYLSMPVISQDGKSPKRGEALVGRGNGFTFKCYSNCASIIGVEEQEITSDLTFSWKLTHRNSTAWVSEEVSRKPSRVVVWSIDHIISPEVICRFSIVPGQKEIWTRKWTFGC